MAVLYSKGMEANLSHASPAWNALRLAVAKSLNSGGYIASCSEVLRIKAEARINNQVWNLWVTTNYEEDVGVDLEGRFGKKGELVTIATQGGGVMLSSPERLQMAYRQKTPRGESSINQREISDVLAGMLPTGEQIKVYPYKEFATGIPDLAEPYAVVTPPETFLQTTPGTTKVVSIAKLLATPLFVVRAGGAETAEKYFDKLRQEGISSMWLSHTFANADPQNPHGTVLQIAPGLFHGFSPLTTGPLQDSVYFLICHALSKPRLEERLR